MTFLHIPGKLNKIAGSIRPLIISIDRTAEGHDPRLVLINFGATEQVVDVTKLTNVFGEKLRVLVAGSETYYEKGLGFLNLEFFLNIFNRCFHSQRYSKYE